MKEKKMTKKILLALVVIALAAVPAFASVQNIKVGGSIDSTYLVRDQFSLITEGDNQNLFLTQTTLRVDADLSENVSATVALLNERVWGEEAQTAADNDVDLNLAFVTLREMLYSPLTVVVGRQNFKYGNSFIIDSGGTNNNIAGASGINGVADDLTKRTAQDAIRLILDYNPLTVELLASKIDSNNNGGFGDSRDDVDLYGVNANYNLGDAWKTVVEGYYFAHINNSVATGTGGTAGLKADTMFIPGLRASTNPIKGLNVQGEVAWQLGNKASTSTTSTNDNVSRHAFGGQAIVNYMLPFEQTAKWSPVVTGVYTYVSGEKEATTNGIDAVAADQGGGINDDYRAWDPMFENQAGGTIYNTLFDLTNAHILTFSGQVAPIEDVTLKGSWTSIWGDQEIASTTANYASFTHRLPGTAAGTLTQQVVTNKNVGTELDVDAMYDYTEDVQLGVSAGWFNPGDFFLIADETASQYLGKVNVRF